MGGRGGGERILHFSTIFDDLMDDIHCSAYFYHFTLYSHEQKIYRIRTGCWITSIRNITFVQRERERGAAGNSSCPSPITM